MTHVTCYLCDREGEAETTNKTWSRCRSCGAMVFPGGGGPNVMFVHESDEMSGELGGVLLEGGLTPIRAKDGTEAIRVLDTHRPPGVVLDVGLGSVLAFELIEYIRNNNLLRHIKVVLVASVFNKTAYKRKPSSLYGADDYVEQHHIPDLLPEKMRMLLGLEEVAVPPEHVKERVVTIRQADDFSHLDGEARVRAMAKRVVGDIALYHQEDVHEAMQGRLSDRLGEALEEGRRVLRQAVDWEALGVEDPIEQAFHAFLEEMRHQRV